MPSREFTLVEVSPRSQDATVFAVFDGALAWARRTLGPWWSSRARVVLACLAVLLIAELCWGDTLGSSHGPLQEVLATQGLTLLGEPRAAGGGGERLVLFSARRADEPADIYVARGAVADNGRVTAIGSPHNLTDSASVDELPPIVLDARHALVLSELQGDVVAVEVLDLQGEPQMQGSWGERLRRSISNWQHTGQRAGVGRRRYRLDPPAARVDVRAAAGAFHLLVDGAQVVIDPTTPRPLVGAEHLSPAQERPPLVAEWVPWTVNTVRAWVGPEPIEWLEHQVFGVRDRLQRAYHAVRATDHEAEVAEELGLTTGQQGQRVRRLSVSNPESGWPPAPLQPLIEPGVKGEGRWRPIVDDPYVRQLPDGSPVFYQTFLRADEQRSYNRVYLTVWDPRQVQLHVVSGTEEPKSATGETGPGVIPRDPQTLDRLVAAFNGGFQALHGEFGMMADGVVYLPPKPWAATVAVYEDGRVGMGSWPGPEGRERLRGYDEARAVAQIPADMISMRQNLTSLVEDGVVNPWQRWWWGAAPRDQTEQTLTQRSALCLTEEGFMLYAWGDSTSPEALGASLAAARCVRAMHLDMNSGHCGMELYNVLPAGQLAHAEPKERRWRWQGALPDVPGRVVRARRAVTSMGMPLPRYVRPDSRDFFYLTLKPTLSTQAPEAGLSTEDLPHAGWPAAMARALRPEVSVIKLDPRRLRISLAHASGEPALAELYGLDTELPTDDALSVYSRGRSLALGQPPQGAVTLMRGAELRPGDLAEAAAGVDRQGFLVYAERTDRRPGPLFDALRAAGVARAIALPEGTRMGLRYEEGLLDLRSVARLRTRRPPSLRFLPDRTPAAHVIFPDNHPMPYARWAFLQDQRVRYFRSAPPSARAPKEVLQAMGLPATEREPTN